MNKELTDARGTSNLATCVQVLFCDVIATPAFVALLGMDLTVMLVSDFAMAVGKKVAVLDAGLLDQEDDDESRGWRSHSLPGLCHAEFCALRVCCFAVDAHPAYDSHAHGNPAVAPAALRALWLRPLDTSPEIPIHPSIQNSRMVTHSSAICTRASHIF
jgi:hypothetical protein